MLKKLPLRDFKWLTQIEISNLDLKKFDVEGDISMILEVDLSYPKHLHDKHRNFPLCPEKLSIDRGMLSSEMIKFLDENNISFNKQERLTQNFLPKLNYVVHIKNLIYYLAQGMKLEKIHRGVKFYQSAWMKSYIQVNTELRKNAVSKFEKDLFKLMINSIFGKTCENPRRYKSLKLINCDVKAKREINKEEFQSFTIINPNLVVAELKKTIIKLNKPIYTGMSILDLSKLHMYQFHFGVMEQKFPDKLQLIFSDTDSLCYNIKKSDITEDLRELSIFLDFSNYPPDHPLFSSDNAHPGRLVQLLNVHFPSLNYCFTCVFFFYEMPANSDLDQITKIAISQP